MNIRSYAVGMAAYNAWMNEKVYVRAAELSDDERKQDLGAFFGSIHATLSHILVGDRAWLQRFRGEPVTMTSPTQEPFAEFADLRRARGAMDRDIAAWARALDEDFGGRPFAFHSVTYGKDRVIPGWAAVAHLFNHQTHHRGQVSALLTRLGRDPGVTDLPWMAMFDPESGTGSATGSG